jgi:hypothetical protein
MAKKRTKAQRSAAAKESWRLRRLRMAEKPTPAEVLAAPGKSVTAFLSSSKLPKVGYNPLPIETQWREVGERENPVTTIGATKEGHEYFVTITHNGSLFRHRVSGSALRKLGLDCLQLVG